MQVILKDGPNRLPDGEELFSPGMPTTGAADKSVVLLWRSNR